ncbi:MAG: hypothetical protein ACC655_03855 [Rhodothermia bacterium]
MGPIGNDSLGIDGLAKESWAVTWQKGAFGIIGDDQLDELATIMDKEVDQFRIAVQGAALGVIPTRVRRY